MVQCESCGTKGFLNIRDGKWVFMWPDEAYDPRMAEFEKRIAQLEDRLRVLIDILGERYTGPTWKKLELDAARALLAGADSPRLSPVPARPASRQREYKSRAKAHHPVGTTGIRLFSKPY